jgi:hypothetical protein
MFREREAAFQTLLEYVAKADSLRLSKPMLDFLEIKPPTPQQPSATKVEKCNSHPTPTQPASQLPSPYQLDFDGTSCLMDQACAVGSGGVCSDERVVVPESPCNIITTLLE